MLAFRRIKLLATSQRRVLVWRECLKTETTLHLVSSWETQPPFLRNNRFQKWRNLAHLGSFDIKHKTPQTSRISLS